MLSVSEKCVLWQNSIEPNFSAGAFHGQNITSQKSCFPSLAINFYTNLSRISITSKYYKMVRNEKKTSLFYRSKVYRICNMVTQSLR